MNADLFYDLDFSSLQTLLQNWGEPAYRARQLWEWLYIHLATDFDQMTNLSRSLRERLAAEMMVGVPEVADTLQSADGETRKDLLRLKDGETVETVLMRYERRRTVCISTQVGCAVGCTFCATGQMGFRRNLSAGEIAAQVLYFARAPLMERRGTDRARQLKSQGQTVTHVVLMGMG